MCSIDEVKVQKAAGENYKDYVNFTNLYEMRTYPKGTRVDSSNYDPYPSWVVGTHMVALNIQTISEPMLLNEAFFADNGYCGYVLKPPVMMETPKFSHFNPSIYDSFNINSKFKALNVSIIGARFIPGVKRKLKSLATTKAKQKKYLR